MYVQLIFKGSGNKCERLYSLTSIVSDLRSKLRNKQNISLCWKFDTERLLSSYTVPFSHIFVSAV